MQTIRHLTLAFATLILLAAIPARAATVLYWDPNGAAAGRGGDGDWDLTSEFWWNGTSHQAWVDGAAPRFDGTAGTVTLKADINVDGGNASDRGMYVSTTGYTFNADPGYELTINAGSDRPLWGPAPPGHEPLNPGLLTINAPLHLAQNGLVYLAAKNMVVNGSISVGGTSTQVAGWSGTLVLNGSNGFTGTTANGGYGYSLQINHDNALGGKQLSWVGISAGPSNPTLTSAAGFDNNQMATFSGANSLTLGNSTYISSSGAGMNVQDAAATLTFASLQEGSGGGVEAWNGWFTKTGPGTLAINGRYSCGGITTVNAGTMLINGPTGDRTGASTYDPMKNWVVTEGAALGGDGTINLLSTSTLTFENGAKFHFDPAYTLTVNGGTVDLGNLSIADILNLDAFTAPNTYTLIEGTATFDYTGLTEIDRASAYPLGGYTTQAYFEPGSLKLVVFVPEPASFALLALAGLALLKRRNRRA